MVDYDLGLAKRGGDLYLLSSCISILAMIMTSRSANSRSSGVDSKEYKELKKKLSQLAQVTQCSLTTLVNKLLSKDDLISDTEHSAAMNTNHPALDRATAVIKSVLTKVWYDSSCYIQFVLALRESGFEKVANDLELAIGQENFTSHQAATSTRSGDLSDSRFPNGEPQQDRESSNDVMVMQPSVYGTKSSNVSAARHAVTAKPQQVSQLKQRYGPMSSTTVHLPGSGNFPARRVTSERSGFRLNSSSQHSAAPNSSKPHLDQFGPPQSISSPSSAACTEPNSAPSESYHSIASDEYTDMHLIATEIHERKTAYFRKAADIRQGETEDLHVIIDKQDSLIQMQHSTIQSLTESLKVAKYDKKEAIKTANDAEKANEESRRQNVATIENLEQQLRKAKERPGQLLQSTKERGRNGSNKRNKKITVAVMIEDLERRRIGVFNKRGSKQLAPGSSKSFQGTKACRNRKSTCHNRALLNSWLNWSCTYS